MKNHFSQPAPLTDEAWRKVRRYCVVTGAWGVLTGYPLFILISEKSDSVEGASKVLHFFGVLAVAVIVVMLTEWLRDTIRGEVRGRRSVSSVLTSVLILAVFEVFVLASEEVSQAEFESPYILREIAAKVSGQEPPYAFLKPTDIKDPEGLLSRLRDGLALKTESPEAWIVRDFARETQWTFFPEQVARPEEHDERLARVLADWEKTHPAILEHDIWFTPPRMPSSGSVDPYGAAGSPHTSSSPARVELNPAPSNTPGNPPKTFNPLSGPDELSVQAPSNTPADSEERTKAATEAAPDLEYEALARKVNTLDSVGNVQSVPQPDPGGIYNSAPSGRVFPNIPVGASDFGDLSGAGISRTGLQALLAVELNRQIMYSSFYQPAVFHSAPSDLKSILQRESEALLTDASIRRSLGKLEESLQKDGKESNEIREQKKPLEEQLEHNASVFMSTRRVVWLNRELLVSVFPKEIAPAQAHADPRNVSLVALGLLWIMAGGTLGWALAKAIRDTFEGCRHPVRRSGVRGLTAGIVLVPAAVIAYVLVIRAFNVVRDLFLLRGELFHLLSPRDVSYGFMTSWLAPIALRLFWFRSHPWITLLGVIALIVFLVIVWFAMLLLGVPRTRRILIFAGAAGVIFINAVLFDRNLIFIFLLVGLVWAIPSLFLGLSTPYLQTGSALPKKWGLIAMGSGITLMLLTLLRLVLTFFPLWLAAVLSFPLWLAAAGGLMLIAGILMRSGNRVEDYWPLVALVVAFAVYGTTAIAQRATFYGVLADVHDLSVQGGSDINLWSRIPGRPGSSAASYSPYDVLKIDLWETASTGDRSLDDVVDRLETWHESRLKTEGENVARRLELSIVGSVGFWLTVGLLAAWATVRPRESGEVLVAANRRRST